MNKYKVKNYHYPLRNNPEERRSQLLRVGNLKSLTACNFSYTESGEPRLFNPFLILDDTFYYLPKNGEV
jgi:hypothetical protein